MLITCDDIQRICDEETLLRFLQETLNLPIPEGATLAQIALPLPLPFLGLDNSIVDQIMDCQDFSGLPQNALGARRPFLIRFRHQRDYPEALRGVAKSLYQKNTDPADILFMCADEYFQPFAFAYFSDSGTEDWNAEVLNIFVWIQGSTRINTGHEHALPINFFSREPSVQPNNLSQDNREDEETIIPDELEDDIEGSSSEDQDQTSPEFIVKQTLSESLLAKLQNTGETLSQYVDIYSGILTGHDEAFVIDESKRKQLIDEDSTSSELIKPLLVPKEKWQTGLTYLIWIPSSQDMSWPWSDAGDELEAKGIFERTFPAISVHLSFYENQLKGRVHQGKFYWEFTKSRLYSLPRQPKIVYPRSGPYLKASYDRSEALPLSSERFIPTEDLSLLAILNSTLFNWYVKIYRASGLNNRWGFRNGFMKNVPIAGRTEAQKENLSQLVRQILIGPESLAVSDFERQIDALVYELYGLTDAEIALITEQEQLSSEPRDRTTPLVFPRNAQHTNIPQSQIQTDSDRLPEMLQNTEAQPTISAPNLSVDEKTETQPIAFIASDRSDSLLAKLEDVGTPLGNNVNIFGGLPLLCRRAFVINEATARRLIAEDPNSAELIETFPDKPGKWKWKSRNVIYIPSSENRRWPWSDLIDSPEAEQVFKEIYPAISRHIEHYRDSLRYKKNTDRFYWEFPPYDALPRLEGPKIIYRTTVLSMKAAYDISHRFLLISTFFIPTTDLLFLSILNSKLFTWYAHRKFRSPDHKLLFFSKQNMKKVPIASGTEVQEDELSALVQLILKAPDNPVVPDIEQEIDRLVYELYELTPAEINLIEEESSK